MFSDPFATPTSLPHASHFSQITPHPFCNPQPVASSSSMIPFVPHTSSLYQRGIRFNTPNQTKIQQQLSGIPPHPLPTPSPYTPQHYAPQLGTPSASFHQPTAFSHPSFTGPPNPFLHPVYFHAQPSPTIVQRPPSNAQVDMSSDHSQRPART